MFSSELISRFQRQRTPFYYYDLGLLKDTLESVKKFSGKYGYHVHYALKANANEPVLQLIRGYGLGADCVSGNEVKKAIETGFSSSQIVFAGVGKSDEEINYALENEIFCFNCESVPELEVIDELAKKQDKKARVALRINPNVNANTHKYITTGLEENKFGINPYELDRVIEVLNKLRHTELIGLHFHIGSQITDLSSFRSLCLKVNEIQKWFLSKRIAIAHVNLGGGLGVDYNEPDKTPIADFENYFSTFNTFLEIQPHQEIHFELGRSVTAQCGSLISRVLYIKEGATINFAILDAGMTDLMRPALYQSYHKIDNITGTDGKAVKYDVVGPICESSDCFGKSISLPTLKRGDLVAIRSAGAYGEVMASNYNLRTKPEAFY